jgi:hypothetical protein
MADRTRRALVVLALLACLACVRAFKPRAAGVQRGLVLPRRLGVERQASRGSGRLVTSARLDDDGDDGYRDGYRSPYDEMEELRPPRLGLREGEKEGGEVDADQEVLWEITRSEDGSPRFRMQPQVSAFEDLWPVVVAYVRGILDFDREGTKRRQAQFTIVRCVSL